MVEQRAAELLARPLVVLLQRRLPLGRDAAQLEPHRGGRLPHLAVDLGAARRDGGDVGVALLVQEGALARRALLRLERHLAQPAAQRRALVRRGAAEGGVHLVHRAPRLGLDLLDRLGRLVREDLRPLGVAHVGGLGSALARLRRRLLDVLLLLQPRPLQPLRDPRHHLPERLLVHVVKVLERAVAAGARGLEARVEGAAEGGHLLLRRVHRHRPQLHPKLRAQPGELALVRLRRGGDRGALATRGAHRVGKGALEVAEVGCGAGGVGIQQPREELGTERLAARREQRQLHAPPAVARV